MKKFSIRALVVAGSAVILAYPFTKVDRYAAEPVKPGLTPQEVASTEPEVKVEEPKKVAPKPYTGRVPNFAQYKDIKAKKTAFFDYLTPTVIEQNNLVMERRIRIIEMSEQLGMEEVLSEEDLQWLNDMAKLYRVRNASSPMLKIQQLLNRVDIVPMELVLVQAANESAWGTSRFARQGMNLFGMWCYKKGCGMVPNSRTEGLTHEVANYSSLAHAVQSYLHNLNTNNAYIVFRSIREQLRASSQPLTAEILATGLLPYSERGSDYVLELTDMLRHNQAFFPPSEIAP